MQGNRYEISYGKVNGHEKVNELYIKDEAFYGRKSYPSFGSAVEVEECQIDSIIMQTKNLVQLKSKPKILADEIK